MPQYKVLAWRLSISMDVSFCIEAIEEALDKYGALWLSVDNGIAQSAAAKKGQPTINTKRVLRVMQQNGLTLQSIQLFGQAARMMESLLPCAPTFAGAPFIWRSTLAMASCVAHPILTGQAA